MVEITDKNIKRNKYNKLIEYLLGFCDTLVFQAPNFFKLFDDDNVDEYTKYEDVDFYIDGGIDNFNDYKKQIERHVELIADDILSKYEDITYYGNKCNYVLEVYVVKISDNTHEFLKICNSLYDWRYPRLPEDLCFFKTGKCILETITHEKLCFIDVESVGENILRKMHLSFKNIPEDNEVLIINDRNRVERIKIM